jgi:hypothetical protein
VPDDGPKIKTYWAQLIIKLIDAVFHGYTIINSYKQHTQFTHRSLADVAASMHVSSYNHIHTHHTHSTHNATLDLPVLSHAVLELSGANT